MGWSFARRPCSGWATPCAGLASAALLTAAIGIVYPDLNVDELRDTWQDDGFGPLFETVKKLPDTRAWLERPAETREGGTGMTSTAPGTR